MGESAEAWGRRYPPPCGPLEWVPPVGNRDLKADLTPKTELRPPPNVGRIGPGRGGSHSVKITTLYKPLNLKGLKGIDSALVPSKNQPEKREEAKRGGESKRGQEKLGEYPQSEINPKP